MMINSKISRFCLVSAFFILSFFSACRDSGKSDGVSIIVATKKPEFMVKIFDDYNKQTYPKKELIIVLNKSYMDTNRWVEKAQEQDNVRVYQIDEDNNLGKSLNVGFEHAKYNYIAIMNECDYYSHNHISRTMDFFRTVEADVIGKAEHFSFFENFGILSLRKNASQYAYSDFVASGTLVMERKVLENVKFSEDTSLSEPSLTETNFCKKCAEKGFKIYSIDKSGFCHIRKKGAMDIAQDKKIMNLYRNIYGGKNNLNDCVVFINTKFSKITF